MATPPRTANALLGALVADALAMPAHWYYDRVALKRDYGELERCLAVNNSITDPSGQGYVGAANIPTLNEWSKAILACLMGLVVVLTLRRRYL